ncbi:MAG TPA: MdtA/MuxA family multidrug efflux RND transporter periplasmic adaptor subunit [Steroidobacteraceae bacterium]|nr:MdtA/MuxA family multidrug efflux RND transporter periplasmic adaptor subunit [Steroidobacteraceae bacterium]
MSEQEETGLLRRHRSTIIVIAAIIVAVLALVGFVRYKQRVQQQLAAQSHGGGGFRLGAGGGGRGGGGRGAPGGANSAMAVSVASVSTGDIAVRIPALGTITPLATVTVKTQISGQLQKIFFTEGQLVKEGDPIALIDPRPYEAALAQMEGNLKRDQALLADARLDLKRYEELITQDSVAQQQVDTQRALVDQYIGTVASDEAQIKTAKINLIYCHITAPVSGRVGLRQVDQGNYVTPGDTNGIVVITELQPITAIFPIPEDNATKVMRQLHSGATLTAEAYDRTNSAKLADGKVLTLDNQIDTTTGTVKLRALFDNQDNMLFPNQFVNIQLIVDNLKNQVVMPNAAVHRGAPNGVTTTFVYLVNTANRTVSVQPVTLGVIDGERVAVSQGVKPGDVVVTEGGDRLRDGAPVMLPATVAANTAAPAAPAAGGAPGSTGTGRQHNGKGTHRNRRPGASQRTADQPPPPPQ